MGRLHSAIGWLETHREDFGSAAATKRESYLRAAGSRNCRSAAELLSFHESLCFARAYPDNSRVYSLAHRLGSDFSNREDVGRLSGRLEGRRVSGTPIRERFFWPTARWLATRFPGHLFIDWEEVEGDAALLNLLPLLFPRIDGIALEEEELSAETFLDAFRARGQTDAEVLVRRFSVTSMPDPLREKTFDDLDLPFVLMPGAKLPARVSSGRQVSRPHFQSVERSRERPDLRAEWERLPRQVRWLSGRRARSAIDEARGAMLTRSRDLDTIAYANPRDVVEIIDDPGLAFVGFGILPERRFLLEGTYVFLVLQNGVPVGYMQGSGLFSWAEINFNVFAPFRGRDAARLYGRSLAVLHAVMGTETFVLAPYQIGDGNEEAIESGAFWFYYKLGFRPRSRRVKQLVAAELAEIQRHPRHRTPRPMLRKLAERPMFLALGDERKHLPYGAVGRAGVLASRRVSRHAAGDRDAAIDSLRDDAAALLDLPPARRRAWTVAERQALEHWAPLVAVLPGVRRWSRATRRALAGVIRARGGPTEAEYLRKLGSHAALEAALTRLTK